jgi:hypothetical protein
MQEARHLGIGIKVLLLIAWQRRLKRLRSRHGTIAALAEAKMHAIALNVADLRAVATRLGTLHIRSVKISERPKALELLRMADDHQLLSHCNSSLFGVTRPH